MDGVSAVLSEPLIRLGASAISLGQAAAAALALLLALLVIFAVALWRSSGARVAAAGEAAQRAREADVRMAGILQAQSELQGRLGAIAEVFGARQAELNQSIGQRLDAMTGRIGQTMTEQTRSTHESLTRLQERLAVIDKAQGNIQSLAGQVVELQAILSNKQTRGAFGQSRMEAIVADGLPSGAFEFQATLSNGNRPDCLIRMPNGAPGLVVDAKFPLEAWNAIRAADGAESQRYASQAFRRDIEVHIRDISDKYLVAGETQDTAFMFVPSESVFAEIHENFEAIVQKAHRSRVVIVSPSLLMLSIQVVQAILKDARMREQAHVIQGEVIRLLEDVSRLDDRVRKLQGHFSMTQKDIELILTSTEKVTKRSRKIEALEFGEVADGSAEDAQVSAESRTGNLRLRVVDDA
ncbi:DNA recombination protein RmuC [Arvimicrobium flavum]|uniref:DNA recombination protein RmuC n=1 Tax=Arvimicrobium flavum TaxID=3393320 RepID=UPI00237AA2F9|nr:DNA recombination protein RmuC [Mesorhizobium shangrilense]